MESASLKQIPDWDRVFRPGVDFRQYPVLKWARGWELTGQLWSEFARYREHLGEETTSSLSPDGRTATFRARISNPAPVEDWTIILGDALHNFRSSLDSLAWELANLDERSVAQEHERSLYFPLAETEARWEKLKRTTLASMPDVIHSRLYTVQPYRFEPVGEGIGLLLNKMSNLDKHRAALDLELRVADKTGFGIAMQHDEASSSVESANPGTPDYEFLAPNRAIKDGDIVFRFRERQALKWARVDKLPLALIVNIDGREYEVFQLLTLIDRQVAGTFINACVGITPPEWVTYLRGEGPRPTSDWFPNVSRYTPEMRSALL
jgi:hypothetical protein